MLKKALQNSKNFVSKNAVKIVVGGVLLLVLLAIWGIFTLIYNMLHKVLPNFVCFSVKHHNTATIYPIRSCFFWDTRLCTQYAR